MHWLAWSIVAVVGWGLWAVVSKILGDSVTAAQSQALSTVGMLPVLAWLGRSKERWRVKGQHRDRWIAFVAGLFACAGNVAYYHALNLGGKVSAVVSITALYPIVTVALALVFLHERLSWAQWLGVVFAGIAIYLFNVGSFASMGAGALGYAMVPIILWGITGLLQKLATNDLPGEEATLWFLLSFLPVAVLLGFWDPPSQMVPWRTWVLAGALGFCFSIGNLALLLAFASGGKASIVAPLTGLYPLISVPIAIVFLGERVNLKEQSGIFVAVLAVVALAREAPGDAAKSAGASRLKSLAQPGRTK